MGPSIEPYFIILATHLSCAMVHMNVGVQSDSLQLMKVLIKHTPTLVARHANTVLNNFINLIARKVRFFCKNEPFMKYSCSLCWKLMSDNLERKSEVLKRRFSKSFLFLLLAGMHVCAAVSSHLSLSLSDQQQVSLWLLTFMFHLCLLFSLQPLLLPTRFMIFL